MPDNDTSWPRSDFDGTTDKYSSWLSATMVGYIAGRLWQGMVVRLRSRRAIKFWGPILSGRVQVVVSRFKIASFLEPTGIVGGGDALALRELSAYFNKVLLRELDVVYVDEARLDRTNNLIVLEGQMQMKLPRMRLN
jgi:hypothetical protein